MAVRGSVCGTGAPGVPSDGEHGARPLAEILDGGPGWPLAGAEHRCAIRQRRLTKRSSWFGPVYSFHCYPRPCFSSDCLSDSSAAGAPEGRAWIFAETRLIGRSAHNVLPLKRPTYRLWALDRAAEQAAAAGLVADRITWHHVDEM